MQVSRSAIQRGAVGRLACRIRLENESLTIIFSRGCAPHPLSLKTRFSLYNIKVLQLLGNRLGSGAALWAVPVFTVFPIYKLVGAVVPGEQGAFPNAQKKRTSSRGVFRPTPPRPQPPPSRPAVALSTSAAAQLQRAAAAAVGTARQREIERENQVIEDLESHIQELEADRSEAELDRLGKQTRSKPAQQAN